MSVTVHSSENDNFLSSSSANTNNSNNYNVDTDYSDASSNDFFALLPNIFLLNVTSLAKCNATNLLATEFLGHKIQIGLICETWLNSTHLDNLFGLPNYTIFLRDRPGRRGGGVAIYVSSSFCVPPFCLSIS